MPSNYLRTSGVRPVLALLLLSLFGRAQTVSPPTRAAIYRSLLTHKVLVPGRLLSHLSYTCPLQVEGGRYFVVDIRELVKGANIPRGVNRIAVLDSTLKPVRVFEYLDRRPLFCRANQLFVFGSLSIDNVGPEGDVLTFSHKARDIAVSQVEANDMPAPVIGKRPIQ